jgi:hypothetical protein
VNLVTENKQEKLETQKTSVSFEGAFMPFVGIGGMPKLWLCGYLVLSLLLQSTMIVRDMAI